METNCSCPKRNDKPVKNTLDSRIRDRFIRTNLDIILIGIVLAVHHVCCVYANETATHDTTSTEEVAVDEHHSNPTEEEIIHEEQTDVYAVLYPW